MAWTDILFDLDGTLIDPAEGITASVRHAARQMGLPPLPRRRLERFIGPPLSETFAEHYGLHGEDIQRAIYHFKDYFKEHGVRQHRLYEGVPAMLAALRAGGRRLHLATTKPVDYAVIILDGYGLTGHFTHIQGSEPGHNGRPKDEIVAMALAGGGIAAADAVMVGDRRHDVAGAHAHGVPCVGVLYGYGGREELERAGADHLVPDVPALQAFLLAR